VNLNDILTSTESMDNIMFVGFVGVLDRGITSCSCTVIDLALFFFGRRRSFVKYFGFVSFVIGGFFSFWDLRLGGIVRQQVQLKRRCGCTNLYFMTMGRSE
jgi:hypothetical protein